MAEASEDLVSVLIPRRLVTAVYQLVAASEERGEGLSFEAMAKPAVAGGWTEQMLRRLCRESQASIRSILQTLAENPDQWLSTNELAEAIGPQASWKNVAGTLGAFTRRCKNRYRKELPYQVQRDHENRQWVYNMSPSVAERILRLLGELAAE